MRQEDEREDRKGLVERFADALDRGADAAAPIDADVADEFRRGARSVRDFAESARRTRDLAVKCRSRGEKIGGFLKRHFTLDRKL